MKPLSVVVAQSDPQSAQWLAKSLCNHFRVVNIAAAIDELRHAIPRHRADVAIVDLELVGFEEIRQIRLEFPATIVVCTHRLADEKMWAAALAAGATDCCYNSDVRAIVLAAVQTQSVAAARVA